MSKHWSDDYMLKKYNAKSYNCGHFVKEVLRKQFNLDVAMPCDVDGIRAQSRTIEDNISSLAYPAAKIFEGAGILLENRSLYHIGIAVEIKNKFYCMHNVKSFGGVLRHTLQELTLYDLKIKGYYQWKMQ